MLFSCNDVLCVGLKLRKAPVLAGCFENSILEPYAIIFSLKTQLTTYLKEHIHSVVQQCYYWYFLILQT